MYQTVNFKHGKKKVLKLKTLKLLSILEAIKKPVVALNQLFLLLE